MSGHGAPDVAVDGTGLRVAVVSARWHTEVMDGLRAGADRALTQAGVTEVLRLRVPGSAELPVACARVARTGRYDVVVALGVVIRGATPHFDHVCQAAVQGVTAVAVQSGVPVGLGVLTCDDEEQARDRAGLPGSAEDKGHEAVTAALATEVALRDAEA